jgi:hypothetical protein
MRRREFIALLGSVARKSKSMAANNNMAFF